MFDALSGRLIVEGLGPRSSLFVSVLKVSRSGLSRGRVELCVATPGVALQLHFRCVGN